MPDDALTGGASPDTDMTSAPPDGGVPSGQSANPAASPSPNLPPSGAPGAQPVKAIGMQALGRSFVSEAVRFLFMAIKALPPGEEFDMAHKTYSQLTKHFRVGPDQAKSQQSLAAMPQAPQPGQPMPPRGPAPTPTAAGSMPQMPGQ